MTTETKTEHEHRQLGVTCCICGIDMTTETKTELEDPNPLEDPTQTKWANRFQCVDATEMIVARSFGAILGDIQDLFSELASVYDADNFDDQGEEATRLVSAAIAIALKCSESAKGYLEYMQPGLRDLMLAS